MKLLLLGLALVFVAGCGHKRHHHKKMWKMMDANNDGKVSKQEFDDAHGKHFTEMDADKDGFVTLEEKKLFMKNSCKKDK